MSNDGFESVGDSNAMWNPRQTGSGKGGDLVELKVTPESWITGYYLGCKTGIGINNATVHHLQLQKVGNVAHLEAPLNEGDKVDLWGSTVMDGKIADNVMPGQLIRIKWEGEQTPKKAGGKKYHGWDVAVNRTVEPISTLGVATAPTKAPDTQPMGTNDPVPAAAPTGGTPTADDDDLPF